MKKSILYSAIIMLSSAMVFPAAYDTSHQATADSAKKLRANAEAENALCTWLPKRKHAKKEGYFYYDDAKPYLALSVIKNMHMHKKKQGIEVFHESENFSWRGSIRSL